MSASALEVFGVTLSEERIADLIQKSKQWALLHGVAMRPQQNSVSASCVEYAPMTLFPSLIPVGVLAEAKALQQHFNLLMHRVANDHVFLEQSLQNVIKVDSFMQRLWEIYTTVRQEGNPQPASLTLIRNDFMLDVKGSCCEIKGIPASVKLKQIEINTISASFAGLSTGMWNVHRYVMMQAGKETHPTQIPENFPAQGLAAGLLKSWQHYNRESAIVLFVIQSNERNAVDQWWIEKELLNLNRDVKIKYATFQNAHENCKLMDDRRLFLNDEEVAVIYYRDGYMPAHYPSEKEWNVRLMMERSLAVKCPSVHMQLAGSKKIQQELARPGVVERFLRDPDICRRIRDTFAGQYSLDLGSEGDKNVAMAIDDPKHFVLKPQREGGGNNIYGEDIREFLSGIRLSEERNAYVLMERVFPWQQRNYLLKEGKPTNLRDVVSELGIYGVYLGCDKEVLMNEEVGHLLRTKSHDDNEGGIVAGFATIDTPLLVQEPVKSQ